MYACEQAVVVTNRVAPGRATGEVRHAANEGWQCRPRRTIRYPGGSSWVRAGLALLVAAAVWANTGAQARAQAAAPQSAPDPAVVEQKSRLLESVLSSSRMSQIAAGRDADGALLVDQARRAAEQARGARAAGDLQRAAALLDQALKACSAASLRLGRSLEEDAHQLARNREMLAEITSYRGYVGEAVELRGSEKEVAELARIDQMVLRASEFTGMNRHAEAGRLLREVHGHTVALLSELRAGHTVVLTLKLDSPADELAYERRSHDGNVALVRRMMREYRIDPERREYVERHLQDSLKYRTQADELADRGDYPAAIGLLEKANEQLLNAVMNASGLTSY